MTILYSNICQAYDKMKEKIKYNFNEKFDHRVIKTLSNEEIYNLADQLKEYIIDTCSVYGGHLSSNLGVITLTLSLLKNFDIDRDKIIFDIGHYTYAYKVLTGRPLNNLRMEGGVDGFQKINESPYDFYDAGHSSTALSAALGFAKARDIKGEDYHVVAFCGDGAIGNGLCFEAINNLIFDKTTKIILVLNDNEMSITPTTGGVAAILKGIRTNPFITVKFKDANFEYIGPVDGDNLKQLEKAFDKAKRSKRSVVLHVKTLKGEGYKYTEGDRSGEFHYVHPFDKKTGKTTEIYPENRISFSKVFSNLMEEELEKNPKSIAICPSTTVGSCLTEVFKKYPSRCFDTGISEEHSAIFASALSLNGFHPFLFMYSTFLQRAYDELIHDVTRIGKGVTLLVDRSGLVGGDGETHQGIYDDGFFYSIPNLVLAMPKDKEDARALFDIAKNYDSTMAIRFTPTYMDKGINNNHKIEFGKWYLEKEGNGNCGIVSVGPHIDDISIALKDDEDCSIVNAVFMKGYDEAEITKLLKYKKIFIYDPYGIDAGFSSDVIVKLKKANYKGNIFVKAIKLAYVEKGTIDQQEKRLGVDVDTFVSFYKEHKN